MPLTNSPQNAQPTEQQPRSAPPDAGFSLAQKVRFLSQPATYLDDSGPQPRPIETVETHMAWVFLTEQHAYKLKKPVRYDFLDFSTLAARYQDGQAELQLNRRLAQEIYLDLVPLTVDPEGGLQLGQRGTVVDWLVKMRRLPADSLLDVALQQATVTASDITRVVQRLAQFYQSLPPVHLSAVEYRDQLQTDLQTTRQTLTLHANGLPGDWVGQIIDALLRFLKTQADCFDQRVYQGKIIEGHGDLRPEHICLWPEVVVIDCLEFSPPLRMLDCVDELAFLALECERLGHRTIGHQILTTYADVSGDYAPNRLINFYQAYRACLRAKLAIWHIPEPGQLAAADWFKRARRYLHLAESHLPG
ncbi:MAG: hypothetical protein AAFY78_21270 [Cyanobacteria bacterium J06648_16]